MSSNGSKSASRDTSIQPCNNPIRISDRFAGFYLLNLIPKVLFFCPGKGNEADAAPIKTPDLITPHHDATCLSINTFFEADNALLYRVICFDADTYYAAIYDLSKIIRTYEIVK